MAKRKAGGLGSPPSEHRQRAGVLHRAVRSGIADVREALDRGDCSDASQRYHNLLLKVGMLEGERRGAGKMQAARLRILDVSSEFLGACVRGTTREHSLKRKGR